MFGSIALPAVFDPRPQPALYAPPQPALYAPPEPAFGAPLAWAALHAWGAPPAWVAPALPADGHAPAVGRERDPAVERRAARREAQAQQRQRFDALVDAIGAADVTGVANLLNSQLRPDVNAATEDEQQTVLHVAAATTIEKGGENAPECARLAYIARMLIARGADPDARCADGTTPLHLAALSGLRSLALELLAGGASAHEDLDGLLPSELALGGKFAHRSRPPARLLSP